MAPDDRDDSAGVERVSEEIRFDAIVYKVQTLVDQGLRVTLDLPETALVAAAQLMATKREGMVLHVVIEPDKQVVAGANEQGTISTRTERKSIRAAS
jgi:hypothetical protein